MSAFREDSDPVLPSGSWKIAAGLCLTTGTVSWLGLQSSARFGHLAPVWWANAFVVAVLLLSPPRAWPRLFAAAVCGFFAAHLLSVESRPEAIIGSLCDTLEILIATALMRLLSRDPSDLTSARTMLRFVTCAVLAAPAVSGIAATVVLGGGTHLAPATFFLRWFLPHALGMATAAPLAIALLRRDRLAVLVGRRPLQVAAMFGMLAAFCWFAFYQNSLPLEWIVFPPLMLIAVELGWTGGSAGVGLIAIIGSILTLHGRGPMRLIPGASVAERVLTLQAFLASTIFSVNTVALVFSERLRLTATVRESERRYRVLAENSRDIIVLTDLEGRRLYVSPAVTAILGFTPQELIDGNFTSQVVHPEDVSILQSAMDELRTTGHGRSLTYRCCNQAGEYIWMESSLNLYRDTRTNQPIGFVNVVRDISGRKAAEQELKHAYAALETLATIDSLTQVANRRRFDEVLDSEWRRAIRTGSSTALLLIDVDLFKGYNDLYGHLRGDECLRQVAGAASATIRRSTDLVARFGGEEFAVILPDTAEEAACDLALQIQAAIEANHWEHAGNPAGRVTVSIGCAALFPARGTSSLQLVEAADQALYRAKSLGRNRVARVHQSPAAAPPSRS